MEQKFNNNRLDLQVLREFCEREGEEIAYRKGDQLEREGDSAWWFAFVTEGCFKYVNMARVMIRHISRGSRLRANSCATIPHFFMAVRHRPLLRLMNLCNAVDRRFLSDRLPNPYTEKDAEDWLKMVTDNEETTGIYRAILCDGKPIGSISVEKNNDDAEIGYMLLNEYTNKGIAKEAVKQVCTIAFKVLSLRE